MAAVLDKKLESKDKPWYLKDIKDQITPYTRELLERYSQIPAQDVDEHIYKIRDILWSTATYPCVGKFQFLALRLPNHPRYKDVLSLLSATSSEPGPFCLDLGCCVAQELRSLAYSGIPSINLYGTDVAPLFLDTSYELFKDKDTFKGTLIQANIFSDELFEKEFEGLEAKFRVIHAGLFLHLFDWEHQVLVCERIIRLLSGEKGSMFLGHMVGCENGELRSGGNDEKVGNIYLHDEASLAKMWNETVEKSGGVSSEWQIEGKLTLKKNMRRDTSGWYFQGEGIGWLTFSIERI